MAPAPRADCRPTKAVPGPAPRCASTVTPRPFSDGAGSCEPTDRDRACPHARSAEHEARQPAVRRNHAFWSSASSSLRPGSDRACWWWGSWSPASTIPAAESSALPPIPAAGTTIPLTRAAHSANACKRPLTCRYQRLMLTTVLRGLAAASLAVLPLTLPTPAHAVETLPLTEAVSRLPVDAESRDGYDRDAFKHWNSGDDPADGCHTRNEVLIAEAVEPPTIGPRCRLSGGSWFSYYDQAEVTSASGLDIDHMVPLAESWDSGASVCPDSCCFSPPWRIVAVPPPHRCSSCRGPAPPGGGGCPLSGLPRRMRRHNPRWLPLQRGHSHAPAQGPAVTCRLCGCPGCAYGLSSSDACRCCTAKCAGGVRGSVSAGVDRPGFRPGSPPPGRKPSVTSPRSLPAPACSTAFARPAPDATGPRPCPSPVSPSWTAPRTSRRRAATGRGRRSSALPLSSATLPEQCGLTARTCSLTDRR